MLDNICRICETESNLIEISVDPNYIAHYLMCGNVSYDIDDRLPQHFCQFCITQLMQVAKFKQKCEQTYHKFKDLLGSLEMEIKEETIKVELNENNCPSAVNDYIVDNYIISEAQVQNDFPLLPVIKSELIINDIDDNDLLTESTSKIEDSNSGNIIKKSNKKSKQKKPYKCEYCDLTFLHERKLNIHLRIHTGETPYKCEHCEKYFRRREHLTQHNRTHTGEKPYKCPDCDKVFSQRANLFKHEKIHKAEKPYKCTKCDESFLRKAKLIIHRKIHSSRKTYKCECCDKCFRRKEHLIGHYKTHVKCETI